MDYRGTLETIRDLEQVHIVPESYTAGYPIGAILLECSDLPPYAYKIQRMTGLPVYDFITMIDWVKQAVVKRPYFGYF